jgi:hypothetical protein
MSEAQPFSTHRPFRATRFRATRFLAALAAAGFTLVAGAAGAVVAAPPAAAATVGYVRLAHLSPDTPPVDVYLSSVAGGPAKKFPAVAYGTVSTYLPLDVGTYAVAMRNVNAAEASPPVLSTQVTVTAGGAFTVAGVGRFADLGLRVINDDLALPAAGKAKVRVVNASIRAPQLDVSVATTGATIATGAAFATTTDYREVNPGRWPLKLQPSGTTNATEVAANCQAGGVYSVLVLDGRNGGLTVEVRVDAKAGAQVPLGGVDTGAGGSAPASPWRLFVTTAAALAGVVAVLFAVPPTRRRVLARASRGGPSHW